MQGLVNDLARLVDNNAQSTPASGTPIGMALPLSTRVPQSSQNRRPSTMEVEELIEI